MSFIHSSTYESLEYLKKNSIICVLLFIILVLMTFRPSDLDLVFHKVVVSAKYDHIIKVELTGTCTVRRGLFYSFSKNL